LGKRGEDLVIESLGDQGFKLLKRNWRTPYGEVDMVGQWGSTLVICEVKTRHWASQEKFEIRKCLGFHQQNRLKKAATWIWLKHRNEYQKVRCGLVLVTGCGIRWFNLPLLYDQA
jgi:putative endonuclease